MAILLLGIILGLLSFYLRVRPRLLQRDFGIDCWYYLLYADELRKTKKIPVKLPYFLLDIEEQWYPPGLPIVLSFFSQKFLEKYHWAISSFIDVVQTIMLFLVSYLLTKNVSVAFFSALLYATSPILVTQNSNLNSRALGALVLTFTMLSLYAYISSLNQLYFFLTILLGAILLHTHKLATQQVFFLLTGFSILNLDIIYFLILIGIFIAAIVLGRGFYIKILKGHIEILKLWRKKLPWPGTHQIYDSSVCKNEKKAKEMGGCGGVINSKLWFNLAKLQFLFLITIILFYFFINNLASFDIFFLTWFILNILTIVIITYFPPLKFLGEGYRYFMYGLFPASFLLSHMVLSNEGGIKIGIFFILAYLFTSILLINKIHNDQKKNILSTIDDDLYEVINFIRILPRDGIMCFPFSHCEHIAYFCRKKTLWGGHGSGYDRLLLFFPIPLKPLEYFIGHYNISYCLVNKRYVLLNDLNLTNNYKIIKENDRYCLIEFF